MIEGLMILTGSLLGLYASYTDIKSRIVSNKLILVTLLAGIVLNGVLFWANLQNILFALKSFLGTLFLSFLLYVLGFVPSGDAKLVPALSLLIPPSFYLTRFPYLPSLPFIINSFVPLALFMTLMAVINTPRGEKLRLIKRHLSPTAVASRFLRIFALSGVSSFVLSLFGLGDLLLASGFMIVGLMVIIERASFAQRIIYALAFLFTLWISLSSFVLTLQSMLIAFLIYGILRLVVMDMAHSALTKEVPLSQLKPGMVAADDIIFDQDREVYNRREEKTTSIFSPLRRIGLDRGILSDKNEGLSRQDLAKIARLKQEEKLDFDQLTIHETVPFAPWIFLGFLITVVGGKSLPNLVLTVI